MRCFFHKYVSVVDLDHTKCESCFREKETLDNILLQVYPKGYCPSFIMVCRLCGNMIASCRDGKTDVIPDSCKLKEKNDQEHNPTFLSTL